MRQSAIVLLSLWASVFTVNSAFADIEYHFVPALNGQPSGNAQFTDVAPVSGPANFQVTIAGAQTGSNPGSSPQAARAYLDRWGLGVLNPMVGNDVGVQGQVQLDGRNGGEYIRLEFPEEVRLTYLTFASVGLTDQFGLLADGQQVDVDALFPGLPTIRSISAAQGNWPGHVDFTRAAQPLGFAKVWDVLVSSTSVGDGIQLENVGVEVPEPSTLVLWLAGLGVVGLSVSRRRALARSEAVG